VQNLKICRRKKVILCTPEYVVLNFTEFYKFLEIHEFLLNIKRPGTEFSIHDFNFMFNFVSAA